MNKHAIVPFGLLLNLLSLPRDAIPDAVGLGEHKKSYDRSVEKAQQRAHRCIRSGRTSSGLSLLFFGLSGRCDQSSAAQLTGKLYGCWA